MIAYLLWISHGILKGLNFTGLFSLVVRLLQMDKTNDWNSIEIFLSLTAFNLASSIFSSTAIYFISVKLTKRKFQYQYFPTLFSLSQPALHQFWFHVVEQQHFNIISFQRLLLFVLLLPSRQQPSNRIDKKSNIFNIGHSEKITKNERNFGKFVSFFWCES